MYRPEHSFGYQRTIFISVNGEVFINLFIFFVLIMGDKSNLLERKSKFINQTNLLNA